MMKSRLFLGRTIGESSSDAKERRRVVVRGDLVVRDGAVGGGLAFFVGLGHIG